MKMFCNRKSVNTGHLYIDKMCIRDSYKGTIEFRLFNSTLHAGEVKSAIQLCLAISHQALDVYKRQVLQFQS